MAGMPHWKTTVAMAAFYAVAAVLLFFAVRDQTTVVVALFVLFALVLLAGNMYVRSGERAQGRRGGRVEGWKGGRGGAPLPSSPINPSTHPPLHPDPEYGRR